MRPTGEWLNQPGGLTERLRALRHASGLTQAELATRLGWTRTKVPKLENGQQMPTKDDLAAWATACGQPEVIPDLLAILSQAEVLHRQWQHELRQGHAALQVSFDDLVQDAAVIRSFQIMLIPGLLQTPEYARYRALEAVRLHGTDESEVDEVVTARMRRQEVLYKPGKRFQFIICKAALDYLLCPPPVMRAQLDRLIVALGMPNIEFGIIPPGRVLPVAPMVGFLMADDVTVVETFTSADTLRGEESAKYAEFADGLMAQAVTGDDARSLITAAARDLLLRPDQHVQACPAPPRAGIARARSRRGTFASARPLSVKAGWLALARQCGLAVRDQGGDLLPGVLEVIISRTVSAAIWFGLTAGYLTLTGRYRIPRKLLPC